MNFPTPETGLATSLKPATTTGASTSVNATGRDFADAFAALPHAKKQNQDLGEQTPPPSDSMQEEADSDLTFQDEPNKNPVPSSHADAETLNQPETAKLFQSTTERLQQADATEPPVSIAREPQSASEILHGLSRQQPAKINASVPAQQPQTEARLPVESGDRPAPRLAAVPTRTEEQARSTQQTGARPPAFASTTTEPRTGAPTPLGTLEQDTADGAQAASPDDGKPTQLSLRSEPPLGNQTSQARKVNPAPQAADNQASGKGKAITSHDLLPRGAENTNAPQDMNILKASAVDKPTVKIPSTPHNVSAPANQRSTSGSPLQSTTVGPTTNAEKLALIPQSGESIPKQSIKAPAQVDGAMAPSMGRSAVQSVSLATQTLPQADQQPTGQPAGLPLQDTPEDSIVTANKAALMQQSGENIPKQSIEAPMQLDRATTSPKGRPAVQAPSPTTQTLPHADQQPLAGQPADLPSLGTPEDSTVTASKAALMPQSGESLPKQSIETPEQVGGAQPLLKDRSAVQPAPQAMQTLAQADQQSSTGQTAGLPLLDSAVDPTATASKAALNPQNREMSAQRTNITPQAGEGAPRQTVEVPTQVNGASTSPKDRPATQPASPAMQTQPQTSQPTVATSSIEQTLQTQQMLSASSDQSMQVSNPSSVQVGIAVPQPAQARTTPRNQNTQQAASTTPNTTTILNPSTVTTSQATLSPASQAGMSTQQQANAEQAFSLLAPSDAGDILNWDAARSITPQTGQNQPLRADIAPQIARQMAEAMPLAAQRPVDIALSPEELGRVRMSISTDDGAITVNILAERPETLDLMRRHIDQLGQTFRSMGYEQITFAFGQGADASDQGTEGDGSQSSGSTGTPSSDDIAAEQPPAETLTPLHTGTTGVDIRL